MSVPRWNRDGVASTAAGGAISSTLDVAAVLDSSVLTARAFCVAALVAAGGAKVCLGE
ncbi:hypothetical protein [Mycobacterium avium]|uniref:hypothetical protein n=1 Tax=Mycobacterium avium TaxID=1764 RepID=UPI0015C7C2BA|nr:hypothetical protein [Mycobacterium avium]MDO2394733.1 hypothetical protein [Mycobacterium avium subsp. hominissuis]